MKPTAAEKSERNAAIAQALEAAAQGTPLADIAASLGLELPALRQWALSKATADQYPEIAELYHHARIIEADRALDRAKDHAEIGKRTQQAKLARFDAERRLSRLWGAKTELTVTDDRPPPDLTEVARRVTYLLHMAALSGVPPALPAARTVQRIIDATPRGSTLSSTAEPEAEVVFFTPPTKPMQGGDSAPPALPADAPLELISSTLGTT